MSSANSPSLSGTPSAAQELLKSNRRASPLVNGKESSVEPCGICYDIALAQSYKLNHINSITKPKNRGSGSDSSSSPPKSLSGNDLEASGCSLACKQLALAQYWESCTEAESVAHAKTFCEFSELLETTTRLEHQRHLYEDWSKQKKVTDDSLASLRAENQYHMSNLEVNLRREQKDALEALEHQHEARVTVLERHRDHYKARFENVQSSLILVEARAKELEDRNKAIQKKNDSCVDAIEKLIREIPAYENKAATEGKVDSEEQSARSIEIEDLKSAKESLEAQNADLLARLEQASKEFSKVEKKYESVSEALQKTEKLNESLLTRKEDLCRRISLIESELETTSKALAKAEEVNSTAAQQVQALKNDHTIEMTCIGKVIDGKAAEIASLKVECEMSKDCAARYSNMYSEALGNLEAASSQSQNAEQRIKDLNGKVEKLSSIVNNLDKDSKALQAVIATKVAENSQLAAKLAEKSAEVEQHMRTIDEKDQMHRDEIVNYVNLWNAQAHRSHVEFNTLLAQEKDTVRALGDQVRAINMQLANVASSYTERSTACTKLEDEIEQLSSSLAEEVQRTLRLENLLQAKEAESHELELDMLAREEENALDYRRVVYEMAQQQVEIQKWFGVEALDDDSVTFVDEDYEQGETSEIDNEGKFEKFDEETDIESDGGESMEDEQEMSVKLDYIDDFEMF